MQSIYRNYSHFKKTWIFIIIELWKYFVHEMSKEKFHFRYSINFHGYHLFLKNLKQIISVQEPFFVTTSSMEYCCPARPASPKGRRTISLRWKEERKTRRGNGKRATPAFDIPLDRSSRPRLEVWIIGREERHPLSNGIRAWCGASKVRQRELSVTR